MTLRHGTQRFVVRRQRLQRRKTRSRGNGKLLAAALARPSALSARVLRKVILKPSAEDLILLVLVSAFASAA